VARERYAVARWLMRVNLWCGLASGFALLAMMVMGALDVLGTNLDLIGLTAQPIPAAFEFMATMMVVNVFLALSLAQSRRQHIRVEVLVNLLPSRWKTVADALAYGFSMALFVLIAFYGWKSGMHATNVGEYAPGLINFPVWPARLVLAFGASLMAVQCAFDLVGLFVRPMATSEAEFDPEIHDRGLEDDRDRNENP
jgi:TRAP-type mannitol/chloroaromatic compound transport system permease small subunit